MLIELLFLDTKIYLIVVDILDKDTNNYRETEHKRHINFQKKHCSRLFKMVDIQYYRY